METKNFKYIKGAICTGQPVDICFYTDVETYSVKDFLWEFDYAVDYGVSEIRIHINSTGGVVVDGISVFSKIIDCPINTVCINDGLAASIASIIWAAGKERRMKDYALLMIHNPFMDYKPSDGESQIISAFTKQISMIYKNRFGFSDEKVKSIMDGEEGNDGTFFTADEAIAAGFVSENDIIKTPMAIHNQVAASIKGVSDLQKITATMALASMGENQGVEKSTIIQKEVRIIDNQSNIESKMNKEWSIVASLLGMNSEKATEDSITSGINDLKDKAGQLGKVKSELEETKKLLTTANTELSGAKASISNLQKDLDDVKASLKAYQDAEEEARKQSIVKMVEDAITSCKINKESKEDWLKMAQNDFETTKKVLDAIPARENISKTIAEQKDNKQDAQEGLKDTEAELKAKVDSVVGKDFKFKTIE